MHRSGSAPEKITSLLSSEEEDKSKLKRSASFSRSPPLTGDTPIIIRTSSPLVKHSPFRVIANNHGYDFSKQISPSVYCDIRLLVHQKTGKRCVGKFYQLSEELDGMLSTTLRVQHFKRELSGLEQIRRGGGGVTETHNVTHIIEHFKERDVDCIVLEYASAGKDMFQTVVDSGRLSEDRVREVARAIFRALADIHALGICHGDIKLENLFVEDAENLERTMLGDFGLSSINTQFNDTTVRGTLAYMSPEVALGQKPPSFASDIWGASVSCLVALLGYNPFFFKAEANKLTVDDFARLATLHYNLHDIVDAPLAEINISKEAKMFFKKTLRFKPEKRPTAQECLKLEFLTKV